MYLIIYRNFKNKTYFRIVFNRPILLIGQVTSMGWTVLDIQVYEIDRFISYNTYQNKRIKTLTSNTLTKQEKRRKIIKILKDIFS